MDSLWKTYEHLWKSMEQPWKINGHMFLIWGFPKMGVPHNGWFIMDNPTKNRWGVPLFQETTINGDLDGIFHIQIKLIFMLLLEDDCLWGFMVNIQCSAGVQKLPSQRSNLLWVRHISFRFSQYPLFLGFKQLVSPLGELSACCFFGNRQGENCQPEGEC